MCERVGCRGGEKGIRLSIGVKDNLEDKERNYVRDKREVHDSHLRLSPVSSTALLTHSVKLATSSQWDHVAMIVQSQRRPDLLRLFEATMEVGEEEGAVKIRLLTYTLTHVHTHTAHARREWSAMIWSSRSRFISRVARLPFAV